MESQDFKLHEAIKTIMANEPDPEKGLSEEVFLMASRLIPLVNTDLLVRDDTGRILLAWRNDRWWGKGWHVPGGVLRLNETLEERIMKTAESELHTRVTFAESPLEIRPIIAKQFDARSHHITLTYDCKVPNDYIINNGGLSNTDDGYLAWHDSFPENMLVCHEFYHKYFKQ